MQEENFKWCKHKISFEIFTVDISVYLFILFIYLFVNVNDDSHMTVNTGSTTLSSVYSDPSENKSKHKITQNIGLNQ